MKNSKVLLANALFILLMTGCASHLNVVSSLDDTRLLVKDVNDGTERIVIFNDIFCKKQDLQFVNPGDTVSVKSSYYKEKVLYTGDKTIVHFNKDTLNARSQMIQFQKEKMDLLQKSR